MASIACNTDPGPLVASAEATSSTPAEKASYRQILKSSALVGGAQACNVAIGIARTKAMALLLGPAGFGLAGVYSSVVDLTQSIAGLGVNSSGVRQIAEAVASDDDDRIALTVCVLRRTSVVLGLIGGLALVLFRRQVSLLTFGTDAYSIPVALLSLAAFCKLVSGGQSALIQGMRRIADLAKINVFGAILGAVGGMVLVYFFREAGIVPYVIVVAATALLTSWWYARKEKLGAALFSSLQVRNETTALLKLGMAFMISSMMTLGVAYGVRITVLHKLGFEATGFYQSAWTLGGLYVGFILQAMAADFYPRLTGSINDHESCNRLVNEQARVGLLLATPGVIATLTFAPVVIAALYSAKFGPSVAVLRWFCFGALLQVISWPMGFIIVAKGKQSLFIFSEVAWAVVSVAFAWLCVKHFGLVGAGMAFFASYIFHALLTYIIARRLTQFSWSLENKRAMAIFIPMVGVVFASFRLMPLAIATSIGTLAAGITAYYSARVLVQVISPDYVPARFRRLLASFASFGSRQS